MGDLKIVGYLNWNKSFGDYYFHKEPRGSEPVHNEKRITLVDLLEAQGKLDEAVKVCDSYAEENQRLSDRAETAEAQLEKYKEALTPSGNTKAEYIGEFTMGVTVTLGHEEETRRVMIPWTTIKEIMAAIRERATTDHD